MFAFLNLGVLNYIFNLFSVCIVGVAGTHAVVCTCKDSSLLESFTPTMLVLGLSSSSGLRASTLPTEPSYLLPQASKMLAVWIMARVFAVGTQSTLFTFETSSRYKAQADLRLPSVLSRPNAGITGIYHQSCDFKEGIM